jgi:hypothetical protein
MKEFIVLAAISFVVAVSIAIIFSAYVEPGMAARHAAAAGTGVISLAR